MAINDPLFPSGVVERCPLPLKSILRNISLVTACITWMCEEAKRRCAPCETSPGRGSSSPSSSLGELGFKNRSSRLLTTGPRHEIGPNRTQLCVVEIDARRKWETAHKIAKALQRKRLGMSSSSILSEGHACCLPNCFREYALHQRPPWHPDRG